MLRRLWDLLIILVATGAAFILPLQLVRASLSHELVNQLGWIATAVFAADLALNAAAARAARPRSRRERLELAAWLAADVLAALPLHVLLPSSPFRLVRLVKLARVAQMLHRWRSRETVARSPLRLAVFLYWLLLAVHAVACGWLSLHENGGGPSMTYFRALYWCAQTLTTVGYGDVRPETDYQVGYAMFVMVLGVGMWGYVIGNVAGMLTRVDPARAHFLENRERLEVFMRYRGLPDGLRKRIREYNDYMWEKKLGYDESEILSGLPPGLSRDVTLFLKRDILEKVPFLKGASEELIAELARELKPIVFTPGEVIFRGGDAGEDMYFISRGWVEIFGRDEKVHATLRDGDFFGEIALLTKQPRTASARAVDYCDAYALEQASFGRVLARHPDFAAHLEERMRERLPRI